MDEELDELYNDLIMEHGMNSYNKKELKDKDFCELGHNPSCGDEIEIELKLKDGKIDDMAFTGHGCAISQASTSIMIDVLKGKTIKDAKELIGIFVKMIDREKVTDEELKKLEEAVAFKNIQNMPARVKCALLAWKTLYNMIDKNELEGNGKINTCH